MVGSCSAIKVQSCVSAAFLCVMLMLAGGCGGGGADLIPASVFFSSEDKTNLSLSPDGERLAWLSRWEYRRNIFVRDLTTGEERRVTSSTDRDIRQYVWTDSHRLAYLLDSDGDENFHVYTTMADGSGGRDLTPGLDLRATLIGDSGLIREWGGKLLVATNERDPRFFDVHRIDVGTGDDEMILENQGQYTSWLADHKGRLRLAVRNDGDQWILEHRAEDDEPFTAVMSWGWADEFQPLTFDRENRYLYALSRRGGDRLGLYLIDPAVGEYRNLIFEHPEVDVRGIALSPATGTASAVIYEAERLEYHFLDVGRREMQQRLEELIPDQEPRVAGTDVSGDAVLVYGASDRSMGTYYLYDRTSDTIAEVARVGPWLDESQMAPMKPVRYEARDGLELTGYLTLPIRQKPNDLPLVVLPHHGHWSRDRWGWNPHVQFLVNRGFAVLQVNYRGSVGFGREFFEAGEKQWGRSMQDDLTDGVRWLVGMGVADSTRVGIMGASYGGYAALAGLAFTPDVYACGVCYSGICDIVTFLESLPPYAAAQHEIYERCIGDPLADREMLDEVSPLLHADLIRNPVMIAHGANDPWCDPATTDRLVAQLYAQGTEVRYLRMEDEGHLFTNMESQLALYRTLEEFFGDHLGGRRQRR